MDHLLAGLPSGATYNASIHISVPGLDSRGYYGGYNNNPSLNTVLMFWLCDDNLSISAFRECIGWPTLVNGYGIPIDGQGLGWDRTDPG